MAIAGAFRTFAFCLLPFVLSGCGYSLAGRGSFLPSYIRVIGVPQFTNNTSTFNLDQIVTTQVRQELQNRGGGFRVVPDATGDAVLTGVITSISIAPSAFNAQQQATRYRVTVTASVEFRDTHTNKVIWTNPALSFPEEYDVSSTASTTSDVNQFFGQNTTALIRLATNFAKSVVTSILENF
jgi:outer membrane lipopolysaccharide assembly protein LptE/RlpB